MELISTHRNVKSSKKHLNFSSSNPELFSISYRNPGVDGMPRLGGRTKIEAAAVVRAWKTYLNHTGYFLGVFE